MKKNLEYFETERLVAEALSLNHYEFIHSMHQDDEIMIHLGGMRNEEETKEYFDTNLNHWREFGYGVWVLKDKETNSYVGRGGLRNTTIDGKEKIELAYALTPSFWNKGLATEFSSFIVDLGFNKLNLNCISSVTESQNAASQKILRKCGFVDLGEVDYKGRPHIGFTLKRTGKL